MEDNRGGSLNRPDQPLKHGEGPEMPGRSRQSGTPDNRRVSVRCEHCQEAFHAGYRRGTTDAYVALRPEGDKDALRDALGAALDLIDHLFAQVPWGQTAGVDFKRLNEVPMEGRRVLKATEGESK